MIAFHLKQRRRLATAGVVILIVVAVVLITGALASRADDPRDTLVRSQAAGKAAGNRPAAIVNGVTIPLADVERVRVNAEVWPITGVDPKDTPSIINFLVGQELQRQEAAKRGIVVTEDEVSAAIARDQEAYPQLLASGQAPANITNLIDAYAKAGHPMAKWQTDPLVRASYYNLLLDVALSGELAKTASLSDKAPGKPALIDQLTTELRKSAKVEILVK